MPQEAYPRQDAVMDLITFNCSSCQQVLKVSADNAGKQAKCPRCGTAMVIPYASTSEAGGSSGGPPPVRRAREEERYDEVEPRGRRARHDDDYDDRRERTRRREDDYDDRPRRSERDRYEDDYDRGRPAAMAARTRWGLVRVGLLLVAIGAIVLAGAALMRGIADLIALISFLGDKPPPTAYKVVGRIGNGIIFGAGLTALVGYVFCIFAPNKYGSLALAIVALALGVVNLVMSLLVRIIAMMKDSTMGGRELFLSGWAISIESSGVYLTFSIIVVVFFFAELIIFPLYLMVIAKAWRARWVGGACIGIVIFAAVTAVFQLTSVILIYVLTKSTGPAKGLAITAFILSLVSYLALMGQMIWYSLVTFQVRGRVE
jgi:hypothetical protein